MNSLAPVPGDTPQLSVRQLGTSSKSRQHATLRRTGASEGQSKSVGTQRPPFSIGPQENRGVICAVCDSHNLGRSIGLAFINIPIAEAVITDVSDTQFYPKTVHKIQMMEASTILMPVITSTDPGLALRSHIDEEMRGIPIVHTPKTDWSKAAGLKCIQDVAFKLDLPAIEFALEESYYAVCAFSAAMKYVHDEFGFTFDKHSVRIKYQPPANVMMISLPTIQSLELLENAQHSRSKDCLFGLLNKTLTPMGSRILRNNIIQPSTQSCILSRRFAAYCESIALVDMLASFASLARIYNYVQPEIQDTVFSLTEVRHPILDFHGVNNCVPNDYFITEESRFQIITGQNMSGKSTYIRAIALVHIMAQIGCFVPAETARLPILHSLFARVSTDDILEASLSTFSVEMREMAFILRFVTVPRNTTRGYRALTEVGGNFRNVNNKSLVLVDELGRATSTRDGLAIAAAISEALLQSGATVYFATHFSELGNNPTESDRISVQDY
ncbi:DNA mismatch repair protein [Grosmannia clavigera kw1407]|uniref:DNA mismatch repair protein n=1 Tax=Grosmannia clavigera (strain kw1407 / UAMH 11150) TaxID=655863 RepID=F0XQS1_GROCL|nr:DNA mismatch repair protein [Grosmannia clavigera kw1407]EFW99922.1 DNA mismatch repair protein [Grosmannia clavigera kw1407]